MMEKMNLVKKKMRKERRKRTNPEGTISKFEVLLQDLKSPVTTQSPLISSRHQAKFLGWQRTEMETTP